VARTATPAVQKRRTRRRLSWRTPAALLIVIGVFAGAYLIVHWYAYSTYYLANDAGTIAVYQGQPGGILWFKPINVSDTSYQVKDLNNIDQSLLAQTIQRPTLGNALAYATYLCSESTRCTASTTGPTTSTTTTSTTTTLKVG
jgi:hypothetical protein